MITTLEELRRLRAILRRACRQLSEAKRPFANVPMGMMLEVPAAALTMRDMLDACDYVSVGSNDLVQYLMAADRDNPKVSHLCQPLAPAVLRVLADVVRACNEAQKPITVCGEMAGQPRTFVMLLGMGLRNFSMSPAFIPTIKDLAAHVTAAQAEHLVQHALELKTLAKVKRYVDDQLRRLAPNLAVLDIA
jgi:phosphotransferase system enzyme I (PtsI)